MLKKQIVRYFIVGVAAYLIEMIALYTMLHLFNLNAFLSVAISFWVGFVAAFGLQKIVAFQNHDRRPHILAAQLVAYSLLVASNYAFTLMMVQIFEPHISVFVIRTIVIIITTVWNFAIYRKLFSVWDNQNKNDHKENN